MTPFTLMLPAVLLILFVRGGESEDAKKLEGGSGRFLWFNLGGQEDKELKGMICAGVGNFALKKTSGDNCQKYADCTVPFKTPHSLFICGKTDTFNRISRTCVPKEFGNCKWCSKEGRHADKTSNHHFIECVAGSVGIRYKCKEGKYDAVRKECKITAVKNVTDVTVDVDYDPPADIIQFMKDWREGEAEEKEDNKSVSTSIEQGAPPPEEKKKAKEGEEGGEEVVDHKKKTTTKTTTTTKKEDTASE